VTRDADSLNDDTHAVLDQAVRSASVTRAVAVARGAIAQLPHLVATREAPSTCLIVADPATLRAAGRATIAALRDAGIDVPEPIVLDEAPRVKPRIELARDLAARFAREDALPIAVGAGVISDVTKCAAGIAGVPCASVATAASMDGYAASGAAMLDNGFKRTFACPPPVAIAADLDVIARAPSRMAPWGYGDMAGKMVAGADWILADAAGEDPLDSAAFALVQDHVRDWLGAPERVAAHDVDALRVMMEGLLVSGFAMQAHGDSRPASGSEHQFAHLWEMDRIEIEGEPAAHGACVGVGTVAMLALYEWLLAQDVSAMASGDLLAARDPQRIEAEVAGAFDDPRLVASARMEMLAKLERDRHRDARVRALACRWPSLKARLAASIVPAATMEGWLVAAGAASHPADLGLSLAHLRRDYRRARLIRRRYTILDVLEDFGWLDRAIDALFASGGFWGRRARGKKTVTPPSTALP
jgi:glycerol-1-phosphate dehydrogenase [NAD(P)+]